MSSYFEMFLACELKVDTPEQVIETLKYMTRRKDYRFNNPPDHSFFKIGPWDSMLQQEGSEFHSNVGVGITNFGEKYRYTKDDTDIYKYALTARFEEHQDSFYDYSNKFLHWLAQYCETYEKGFVGYYRSDIDSHPTLIYFQEGKASLAKLDSKSVFLEEIDYDENWDLKVRDRESETEE